jgi:chitinase
MTISVPVNGDRVGEATETFSVRLTGATNSFLPGAIGYGTIVDDEPRISIDPSASVTEGNAGTTPMNFFVHLAAAYDAPVTVNYSTVEGDTETWKYDYYYYFPPDPATSGVDFQGQTGTLTFAPGQTAKTIAVLVNGDHTPRR